MKTYLNLLPVATRRRQMFRCRIRQWSAVWTVLLIVVAAVGSVQFKQYRSWSSRLTRLEHEQMPVKKLRSDLVTLRKELADLRESEALVLELSERRPMLTLLGFVSRAACESDGGVFVSRLNLEPAPDQAKRRNEDQANRLLKLEGLGVDNLAIARFAAALRGSEAFQQVRLESTGDSKPDNQSVRNYVLECTF